MGSLPETLSGFKESQVENMRLTFSFDAQLEFTDSGCEAMPKDIERLVVCRDRLENYLEVDLADIGVSGGEIWITVSGGKVRLNTTFSILPEITKELVERILDDTVAQLDDGMGEGGFEFFYEGDLLVVRVLTEGTIGIDISEDIVPPPVPSSIAISARDGDTASLVASIEADGGNIDKVHQGCTGLHYAISNGQTEAIRILLQNGADPNPTDLMETSPLEVCALSNDLDDEQSRAIALLLLEAGADPNHVGADGETARSYAEVRNKERMAAVIKGASRRALNGNP